jgi:hypothetical protein
MSYYSWVNLQYPDFAEINISELTEGLKAHLDQSRIHHDVVADVSTLFSEKEAEFKLYGNVIDDILVWISAQRPSIAFGVQGRGEELRDVWVREYLGGQVTYSEGPFE